MLLHRTFEELNETITHREVMDWQGYSELDPSGFWGAHEPMSGLAAARGPQVITGTPEELSRLIDQQIFGRM